MDLSLARQTFITEAKELLQEIENSLLRLEKNPHDDETVNTLFRAVHTIKGSSGIVGMDIVEGFTHFAENLLTKVRDGEIPVTNSLIELLLESRDHIAVLVDLSVGEVASLTPDVAERQAALLERFDAYIEIKPDKHVAAAVDGSAAVGAIGQSVSTDAWHISLRFGKDLLRNGMDPMSFINYLSKLGTIVSLDTVFDSMPRAAEMDPESCYLGVEIGFKTDFDKKAIEDVFEFIREDCQIHILPPHSLISSYVALIKALPEDPALLGELLVKGGALTQSELDEALRLQSGSDVPADSREGKKFLGEILVNKGMVAHEVVDAALEKQSDNRTSKSKEALTIRIDAARLDALMNMVGELVIANANINQHVERLQDAALMESAAIMMRLVEDVRDTTMRTRMVPIGETFSRFNRVVRDISRDFGKDIDLVITGAETELDKTVIEKITDPLMHLVRNAADHGIEKPDVRTANGKPAKGRIRLHAYHDAGSIVIEITDDGRGLSRDRILDKAVSLGLAESGQTLTDSDIYSLIFEPGFSTASEVTKLSGRGVGMDVVRRNIDALRGSVAIDSVDGMGTTVRIRLPLTLAIIDGFMVEVNSASYVIPLEMVVECVEMPDAERRAVRERGYINLRGDVLPYIRLRTFFGEPSEGDLYESIVIVKYGEQKVGLVVDFLQGEVQTVIKTLGAVYKNVHGISGATIMGNGTVALILDIPTLVETVVKYAYECAN
ncbi:MAG: chemotaxis protein CheA [Deltaproteobacteria bacterium RIFCSPLOWO2_02_FULL_53_8]|nr:MAG: chemotaxis protein CheA [Deltaproteobacteria bacterium RIFCSPLOWO2_02_FULL_53_8]